MNQEDMTQDDWQLCAALHESLHSEVAIEWRWSYRAAGQWTPSRYRASETPGERLRSMKTRILPFVVAGRSIDLLPAYAADDAPRSLMAEVEAELERLGLHERYAKELDRKSVV